MYGIEKETETTKASESPEHNPRGSESDFSTFDIIKATQVSFKSLCNY